MASETLEQTVRLLHGPHDGSITYTSIRNSHIYVPPNPQLVACSTEWYHAYFRCSQGEFLYAGYEFKEE